MPRSIRTRYNWTEIQQYHDEGHTWREIQAKFGVVQASITKAQKRGDFISKNHSEANKNSYAKGRYHKHTQATKDKISKARIKYLTDNQNGMYEYDFAWPKQKIDVEIDGSTHNLPKVQKIDARRDKFSTDNGWIVIRFSADRVKKDIIGCINELKALL